VSLSSWGGLPAEPQHEVHVSWVDQVGAGMTQAGLPVGCGRSYGDSGLAASGTVLQMRGLNCLHAFDLERGVLRCEGGITLGEILTLAVPSGWILPVLPGTRFVTVAGAVANDIHGKNHGRDGTFGCHLLAFGLQRSDGEVLECSPTHNPDWFAVTIGGLGLTGVILWVELQLQPVAGPWLSTRTTKFSSLDEFFALSGDSGYEYNAAWLDCLSADGRGHFTSADHCERETDIGSEGMHLTVPFTPWFSPVNRFTMKLLNGLYYRRQWNKQSSEQQSMYRWFFPLDGVRHWNRMYGKAGFRQYQCVVPREAVRELLSIIRRSGEGSFLAVLKQFGERQSPGLISFPRPGVTLALDFPWRGRVTEALFESLDAVVTEHNGAVYPAKDAHMSAQHFQRAYPAWEQLEEKRDLRIQSLFWQRVTGEVPCSAS
jgi:FAD/FMN-containing dehydrogenase